MKFVFPKNYRYRGKILGFIDYVTAIVDLIIGILFYLILKLLISNIATRLYIFIILSVPVILISVFIADGENIIVYFIKIFKFLRRRGVYFYGKT